METVSKWKPCQLKDVLTQEKQTATPETEVITGCKNASKFLCENGYQIALSTLWKHIKTAPAKKFHKSYIFKKSELIAWAENGCKILNNNEKKEV
jgi:hypothetical protein